MTWEKIMAEAGDKDKELHLNVEREIEEILRRAAGEDAPPLKGQAERDVEEAIASAEGKKPEIPAPKQEQIKALYTTLSDSLEKLGIKAQPKDLENETEFNPVSVEGLGEVTMYFAEQVPLSSPESKIIVVVRYPENENDDLRERMIIVGSEGRFVSCRDRNKHGRVVTGYLYSNASPTFSNVESVVTAIASAASKK